MYVFFIPDALIDDLNCNENYEAAESFSLLAGGRSKVAFASGFS